MAHQVPVRPAPHRISSATNSTWWRSQISRIVRKYSGRGVDAPVAEPPTGSAMPPRLAGVDPVLPGDLERGLHGLRATGQEVELVEIARQGLRHLAGERFHGTVRERRRRQVAELARLPRQRVGNLGIRVT